MAVDYVLACNAVRVFEKFMMIRYIKHVVKS